MKSWATMGLAAAMLVAAPAAAQNWNANTVETEKGFRLGNPDAPVNLIEFVSYTCPHCADFERESEAELRYLYVREGVANVEIRHFIRNPIDVAAALVTECGVTDNFFENHRVMLATQDGWLAKAQAASTAQQARWSGGTIASRMRAIATDLDFYEIMESRGYSFSDIDRCVTDTERAIAIAETSRVNAAQYGVTGTPTFVLNDTLLPAVHSWTRLGPILSAARQEEILNGQKLLTEQ